MTSGAVTAVLGPRGRDGGIKEGQKLRVLMAPTTGSPRVQPIRVIIASDNVIDAVVALADTGKYVSVDVKNVDTEVGRQFGADRRRRRRPQASVFIRAFTKRRCATRFRIRSSTS